MNKRKGNVVDELYMEMGLIRKNKQDLQHNFIYNYKYYNNIIR